MITFTPNKVSFKTCPRCQSERVIDLGETIECMDCKGEYEKEEILNASDPSDVLSIKEKMGIIEDLFLNEDEDKNSDDSGKK